MHAHAPAHENDFTRRMKLSQANGSQLKLTAVFEHQIPLSVGSAAGRSVADRQRMSIWKPFQNGRCLHPSEPPEW